MQPLLDSSFYFMMTTVILLQFSWLSLMRSGGRRYLRSIVHHHRPNTALARAYAWRLERPANAVIEGGTMTALVIFLMGLHLSTYTAEIPLTALFVVGLAMALYTTSTLQTALGVKRLTSVEKQIADKIDSSVDRIGSARTLIDELVGRRSRQDSVRWLALFRIALRDTPLGWSVRDALMEKRKSWERAAETSIAARKASDNGQQGPSIT
ncbi:MAG: hypothetical protein HXY34_04295 [Candidatus Thorarchaeota archaeon]|nr:hypothetical protein [Candidatus Thorarchaeota archaeon]